MKKPGPFFEASPNNFYLDKLTYRYDDNTNDNNLDAIEGNNDTNKKTKINENEVESDGKGGVHQIFSPISNSESTNLLTDIDYDFFFNWQTEKQNLF